MSKRCNVCDGTGWVDDPPATWASEPGEHGCIACSGTGELEDDDPSCWDEDDWKYFRQLERTLDKWFDALEYPN